MKQRGAFSSDVLQGVQCGQPRLIRPAFSASARTTWGGSAAFASAAAFCRQLLFQPLAFSAAAFSEPLFRGGLLSGLFSSFSAALSADTLSANLRCRCFGLGLAFSQSCLFARIERIEVNMTDYLRKVRGPSSTRFPRPSGSGLDRAQAPLQLLVVRVVPAELSGTGAGFSTGLAASFGGCSYTRCRYRILK